MRAYNIRAFSFGWDTWIDLDHVLAITDIRIKHSGLTGCYEIFFMFRNEPLCITFDAKDEKAKAQYNDMLDYWKEVQP